MSVAVIPQKKTPYRIHGEVVASGVYRYSYRILDVMFETFLVYAVQVYLLKECIRTKCDFIFGDILSPNENDIIR